MTQAEARGLKVPLLRSLVSDGAYAQGVVGVWPTTTYPSHTTLLTGVRPAEHGIYNNLEFDPKHTFGESWFWYAHHIRVPTLWQMARDLNPSDRHFIADLSRPEGLLRRMQDALGSYLTGNETSRTASPTFSSTTGSTHRVHFPAPLFWWS